MATSGKQQPIRWVRFRVRNVRNARQLKMLNLPEPGVAPPAKTKVVEVLLPDPTDIHAGTQPGEEIVLDLPDPATLPPVKETAVLLLRAAAEIEHGLLVQYLYAAYSLSGSQKVIAGIAIEEMSHLMTVQNLLLMLGQPPHLQRQDFDLSDADEDHLYPFPLRLEPLSKHSLAKYILAEAPESADAQQPVVMGHVRQAAGQGAIINRVGLLYAFLGVVFGNKQFLMERAAEGDEWYEMVHRLAAILARIYGGRDRIHLPDSAFPEPNPNAARQGTDEEWDRSIAIKEFRVHPEATGKPLIHRGDALSALRDIGIQGEGASAASQSSAGGSHFQRFLDQFTSLFPPDGAGTNAVLVHAVPSGAVINVGGAEAGAITHPQTQNWARLANLRYALLLGFLEQYLVSAPSDRAALAPWMFAEMFNLKSLGALLVRMDRTETASDGKAAVPFTLPPAEEMGLAAPGSHWPAVHTDRLTQAVKTAQDILDSLPNDAPIARRELLASMLESDRRKLAEAEQRRTGGTARTKFDRVREILDLATGTSSPPHRRFWNVPLADFKTKPVLDLKVVETDGEDRGARSALVKALKGEAPFDGSDYDRMPLHRTPVGDTDIAFIQQWIDEGCKDEPLDPPTAGQNPPPAPNPNT